MAFVKFYNGLGTGGELQAGNFFSNDNSLVPDGNETLEAYDFDTEILSGSFNGGEYYYSFFIDSTFSTYVYEIGSMYLYDSNVNSLIDIYDINIAFDIRDDFSGDVYFSNILSGNDWIVGNRYSDYLEAGSGNDVVRGNSGNDFISGQNGNDKLYGGSGGDRLLGGSWGDRLYGGSGSDRLNGQDGNDKLYGGSGKDTMFGGSGADTFVFNKLSDSRAASSKADVIKDFKHGVDHIDLRSIDASSVISRNNAFTFDGTTQFGTSKSGDIYYEKFNLAGTSRDYTMVYIDNDADRGVEMSIRLDGLINITAGDFLL